MPRRAPAAKALSELPRQQLLFAKVFPRLERGLALLVAPGASPGPWPGRRALQRREARGWRLAGSRSCERLKAASSEGPAAQRARDDNVSRGLPGALARELELQIKVSQEKGTCLGSCILNYSTSYA